MQFFRYCRISRAPSDIEATNLIAPAATATLSRSLRGGVALRCNGRQIAIEALCLTMLNSLTEAHGSRVLEGTPDFQIPVMISS